MKIFKIKSNDAFGLDIGYETIKLVSVTSNKKGIYLVGATEVPLTERILERDHFKNKAKTATLIKDACRKALPSPIRARRIVSALPETFVFSKTIQMPKMTKEEYTKAIPIEAAQYLPIPVEKVYIDFQIMIVHPDEPLIDLLFVAAPKQLVDDYVEVIKMAGFELSALETKPLAVGRAVAASVPLHGAVICEIGTEITRLSLWDNNNIRFSTSVPVGNNQIKESLDHEFNSSNTIQNSVATSMLINPLSQEILSTIKYHQSRDFHPSPVEKIYLCGSGAKIPGVDKFIEQKTNLATEIILPNIKNNHQLGTEFTTAFGLALRGDLE
ncbi:MAG: type IV pilus assembly protein PilM [Candidatus Azambacteria bacterium]|nr:type IV pilus assembly protein PilM [Candidatus Azambacteria bacterium]